MSSLAIFTVFRLTKHINETSTMLSRYSNMILQTMVTSKHHLSRENGRSACRRKIKGNRSLSQNIYGLLHSILLYPALLYSTPLYSSLLYSTLLLSTLLYPTLLHSTLLNSNQYFTEYSTYPLFYFIWFSILAVTLSYPLSPNLGVRVL